MATAERPVEPLIIARQSVEPGTRKELELRPARLPSGGWMAIPVVVIHGAMPGPTMWLSAAVHGDEVCGVEIIRQVLNRLRPIKVAGTLLAVPVVNIPGFASGNRYLPDRRDLNRSFPGSARGSLASRFAHSLMTEIIDRCDLGIDLHTGSDHRSNLPQIRADLGDAETRELVRAFAPPVALHAGARDGSLREAAARRGATTLLYEAGEAWRFSQSAIDNGVAGVVRVMHHAGMLAEVPHDVLPAHQTLYLHRSNWSRSPMSGVARIKVELGEVVVKRQRIAIVADAIGSTERAVRASSPGVVIGRTELPVVHRGDALVHIAPLGSGAHLKIESVQ